jgi:hypothetical protein
MNRPEFIHLIILKYFITFLLDKSTHYGLYYSQTIAIIDLCPHTNVHLGLCYGCGLDIKVQSVTVRSIDCTALNYLVLHVNRRESESK